MIRLLFSLGLGLLLSGPRVGWAQLVVEKAAPLAPGQPVELALKFATTIRVRPATDGQLRVRATISINQNKLNDAFSLSLSQQTDKVLVASELDQKRLVQAQPGDCPEGKGSTYYYGDWKSGQGPGKDRAAVCSNIVVEVTVPAATALRISTISGDIDVQGLSGELQAKSISGFVDVSWPPARPASVALKTITGEVYTDQEVAFANRKENPIVGYEVRGALGAGAGPTLRLESVSGDVFFRRARP